jgi:hypothetical protein
MKTLLLLFGNMLKNSAIIILSFIVLSCSSDPKKGFIDEAHRPQDWQAELKLTFLSDTIENGVEEIVLVDKTEKGDYQAFVDQLFDLAFSGDVKVYLPNALSEKTDDTVSPKELYDALEQLDSVQVENLLTGEFSDTVIDNSFKKERTTFLEIECKASKNGTQIQLIPYSVSIGEQVFNDDGVQRGFKPNFFIQVNQEWKAEGLDISLTLQTDSLGLFKPTLFTYYRGNNGLPFQEMIDLKTGESIEAQINLGFDFSDQSIWVEPFEVKKPLVNAKSNEA